ncbi:hypothetical protein TNCV_445111 [Trichonephila clavipes]|nr:hypothetical protein TNCV_445111 [Trichonephila clavipes]
MAPIYHTSADEIRHEKLRLGGEKEREKNKKRKSKRGKGKASFSICSQTKRKSSGIEGFHLLAPPLARPGGVGTFSFVCNVRRIVKARLLLTSAASFFLDLKNDGWLPVYLFLFSYLIAALLQ